MRGGIEEDEVEEQRRNQLYQLGQIIKTLDDYKLIKTHFLATEKLAKDLDQWRHHLSQQQSRDIVMKQDLNLLIEMLKRETEVAMRTHFEHFKAETDAAIVKKADLTHVKSQLQGKVSTSEFWKEIEYVKSMIHTMSRELAVSGITS